VSMKSQPGKNGIVDSQAPSPNNCTSPSPSGWINLVRRESEPIGDGEERGQLK